MKTCPADFLQPLDPNNLPDLDRNLLVRRPETHNNIRIKNRWLVAQLRDSPHGIFWFNAQNGQRVPSVEAWAYIEAGA